MLEKNISNQEVTNDVLHGIIYFLLVEEYLKITLMIVAPKVASIRRYKMDVRGKYEAHSHPS
jgi:hypothetical protein